MRRQLPALLIRALVAIADSVHRIQLHSRLAFGAFVAMATSSARPTVRVRRKRSTAGTPPTRCARRRCSSRCALGYPHHHVVGEAAPGFRMTVDRWKRLCTILVFVSGPLAAQPSSTGGPPRGSLVLQGGVGLSHAIDSAFVALAGGPASRIVVIPTASVGDAGPAGMATFLARRMKESFGVASVTVLHSLARATSDSDDFVEPLRRASGVWILGGFPERLVQSYVGTRTERAIRELLGRGGVVGGESAGAMIQASWLDTTDAEFTSDIRAVIRTQDRAGFGLLTHAGIFPHFDKRGSGAAVKESAAHPDQLAIGIDEGTALIVTGDRAEVVGLGTISVYDGRRRGASSVIVLRPGDRYDLAARRKAP